MPILEVLLQLSPPILLALYLLAMEHRHSPDEAWPVSVYFPLVIGQRLINPSLLPPSYLVQSELHECLLISVLMPGMFTE